MVLLKTNVPNTNISGKDWVPSGFTTSPGHCLQGSWPMVFQLMPQGELNPLEFCKERRKSSQLINTCWLIVYLAPCTQVWKDNRYLLKGNIVIHISVDWWHMWTLHKQISLRETGSFFQQMLIERLSLWSTVEVCGGLSGEERVALHCSVLFVHWIPRADWGARSLM